MKRFNKITNRESFKSITVLTTGSFLAQLIVVLSAPLLTRLYTPEQLGEYTYLLSITFIFMGVINGRYEQSIVVEKTDKRVYALIKLSFIVGMFLSVLITVGYFLILVLNGSFYDKKASLVFIFGVLLTYAIINVLTSYNNRMKEYKVMSFVYIIRTGFQNLGAIAGGLIKLGTLGLTLSYFIGQAFGIRQQGKTLLPNYKKVCNATVKEMKEVAVDYKRQPLYAAPAALANSFSYSSITIFIESLFGYSVVGLYSISVRLLGLPLSVISGNVSKVFFETASNEFNKTGQYFTAFRNTFLFQLVIAIPMVVIMMLFAPSISEFVFGKEWKVAGDYIVILAPMFGIRFIVTTLTLGVVISSKQKTELFIQILFIIASLGSYITSRFLNLPIESLLYIVTISFSIIYLLFLLALLHYSRVKSHLNQ